MGNLRNKPFDYVSVVVKESIKMISFQEMLIHKKDGVSSEKESKTFEKHA